MVRTTIILETQLYRELVEEAVRKYGSTRKLSLLINQKLKGVKTEERGRRSKRLTFMSSKPIKEKDIERAIERGRSEAVKWSA